jgi:outer membrane protein
MRFTVLVLLLTATTASAQQATISLPDAVNRALAESDAIAVARAGVTRARGEVIQARSNFLPQLAANAGYTRILKTQYEALANQSIFPTNPNNPRDVQLCTVQLDSAATPAQRDAALAEAQSCTGGYSGSTFSSVGFGAKNAYNLGLTFSQSIFNGQFLAAQGAASVPRAAADVELDAQRAQVIYDVAQAYYDAALASEMATIADSTLAQDERTLAQTQLGRRMGTASEYDLLQSQVTRDNQVPVTLAARNGRDQASYRLKQLLKLPLDAPVALSTRVEDAADLANGVHLPPLTDSAASVPIGDTASERRSSVREQAYAVREFEAMLSQNRAEYLPSLTLVSAYSRAAYPTGGLPAWNSFLENFTVGIGASIPIFNGFKTHGDVLVAEANLAEQRARLRQTTDLAALDARSALGNLGEAESTWRATASSVDQAARAYSIAEVRYQSGLSTLLELNASRLGEQQSLANRAQAARNLQVARLRLALIRDLPLQQGGQQAPPVTSPSPAPVTVQPFNPLPGPTVVAP